ncbi:MAG: hypothetical protein WC748_07980 [Legionellales bacterium]|jgi:uncharacterized lipoprotein
MFYKLITGFIFLGLLAGCSTAHHHYQEFNPDRELRYLDEQADEPLILPEDVVMLENYQSPYIIPAGPLPGPDAEPMNLVPPGGYPLWERAEEELERAKARTGTREDEDDA